MRRAHRRAPRRRRAWHTQLPTAVHESLVYRQFWILGVANRAAQYAQPFRASRSGALLTRPAALASKVAFHTRDRRSSGDCEITHDTTNATMPWPTWTALRDKFLMSAERRGRERHRCRPTRHPRNDHARCGG